MNSTTPIIQTFAGTHVDGLDLSKIQSLDNLVENKTSIRITGAVEYSHIATKIDGVELENLKKNSNAKYGLDKPFFKIAIRAVNPAGGPASALNFAQPFTNASEIALAKYVEGKMYSSTKPDKAGFGPVYYSATSKGSEIRTYHKKPDGTLSKVQLNGNELAVGSMVELEISYFKTQQGAGVGLNSVIILDPVIKSYSYNNNVKGYVVNDDVVSLDPATAPAPAAPVAPAYQAPVQQPTYAQQMPMQQAPVQQPMYAQQAPMQQMPMQQTPVQQPVYAQQAPMQQPEAAPGSYTPPASNIGMPQQTPGYYQQPVQANPGITETPMGGNADSAQNPNLDAFNRLVNQFGGNNG